MLFLVVGSIQISLPSHPPIPINHAFVPCFIKLISEGLEAKGKYSKHLGQTNNYPVDHCCVSWVGAPCHNWNPQRPLCLTASMPGPGGIEAITIGHRAAIVVLIRPSLNIENCSSCLLPSNASPGTGSLVLTRCDVLSWEMFNFISLSWISATDQKSEPLQNASPAMNDYLKILFYCSCIINQIEHELRKSD